MAVTINGTTGITSPGLSVDSPTLVVDDANNRVGIGTPTPGVIHYFMHKCVLTWALQR